jgi:hypothetical protein
MLCGRFQAPPPTGLVVLLADLGLLHRTRAEPTVAPYTEFVWPPTTSNDLLMTNDRDGPTESTSEDLSDTTGNDSDEL